MRLLLLSYEFTFSPFSGNGILARSLAKALLSHGATLRVLCCGPASVVGDESADQPIREDEVGRDALGRLGVWRIELGSGETWRRLDRAAAVGTFGRGCVAAASDAAAFAPEACIAIDWTGAAAWRELRTAWPSGATLPPLQYFNFRVYSAGMSDHDDAAWHDAREKEALEAADTALCLSKKDREALYRILSSSRGRAMTCKWSAVALDASTPRYLGVHVIYPALRDDIHDLASLPSSALAAAVDPYLPDECQSAVEAGRRFLICVVRLSSEKQPLLFARIVDRLARLGELRRAGIVPLLAGAPAEPEYAEHVRNTIWRAGSGIYPEGISSAQAEGGGDATVADIEGRGTADSPIVLTGFLSSKALAAIFRHTALNVHPCAYDAYGMTVVEAAAFGVPTLLQGGGAIGASALLGESGCLQADVMAGTPNDSANAAANEILCLLRQPDRLARVGATARARALEWNEKAFGAKMLEHLHALKRVTA